MPEVFLIYFVFLYAGKTVFAIRGNDKRALVCDYGDYRDYFQVPEEESDSSRSIWPKTPIIFTV